MKAKNLRIEDILVSVEPQALFDAVCEGLYTQGGKQLGTETPGVLQYISAASGTETRCSIGFCLSALGAELIRYDGLNAIPIRRVIEHLDIRIPDVLLRFLVELQAAHDTAMKGDNADLANNLLHFAHRYELSIATFYSGVAKWMEE